MQLTHLNNVPTATILLRDELKKGSCGYLGSQASQVVKSAAAINAAIIFVHNFLFKIAKLTRNPFFLVDFI
jgi:hypothetical protein